MGADVLQQHWDMKQMGLLENSFPTTKPGLDYFTPNREGQRVSVKAVSPSDLFDLIFFANQ